MQNKKGIGGHQSAKAVSIEWLTPPHIIQSLGSFDLDPCSPIIRPWDTARHHFNVNDDGLSRDWFGRVWMNPPYGDEVGAWLKKLCDHGNGVTIIFARTETDNWFNYVWNSADAALFLKQRPHFHRVDGSKAKGNSGGPIALIAYGKNNFDSLEECGLPGKFIPLNYTPVIVVGVSPSWVSIVSIAITRHGDKDLKLIYTLVERMAPEKVIKNPHWKEKVRQKVQVIRNRLNNNK